jgi:hypothetical protein
MVRDPQTAADKFDDEHYPAYTMGRAAEMLGTTPGFLRSLDEVKLLVPQRSAGGTAATPAISCGWPPGSGHWPTKARPWTRRAASSSWRTSSRKPAASTPS